MLPPLPPSRTSNRTFCQRPSTLLHAERSPTRSSLERLDLSAENLRTPFKIQQMCTSQPVVVHTGSVSIESVHVMKEMLSGKRRTVHCCQIKWTISLRIPWELTLPDSLDSLSNPKSAHQPSIIKHIAMEISTSQPTYHSTYLSYPIVYLATGYQLTIWWSFYTSIWFTSAFHNKQLWNFSTTSWSLRHGRRTSPVAGLIDVASNHPLSRDSWWITSPTNTKLDGWRGVVHKCWYPSTNRETAIVNRETASVGPLQQFWGYTIWVFLKKGNFKMVGLLMKILNGWFTIIDW